MFNDRYDRSMELKYQMDKDDWITLIPYKSCRSHVLVG